MKRFERICLVAAGLSLPFFVAGIVVGHSEVWRWAATAGTLGLAIGIGAVESLRTYRFTAWILAAVTMAMCEPALLQPFEPGGPNYKLLLLVMIQAVMFGVGTQMSLSDFAGVVRTPWPVAVGVFCQFTIMPLLGYGLALAFRLPPELAAGLILIGSCSSGLSSNVMVYISGANLPLSITLSAITTLLAPIVTPFWFTTLAGNLLADTAIEVSFLRMMTDIIKIVIVPIGAAQIHDFLKHASPTSRRIVGGIALLGFALPLWWLTGGSTWLSVESAPAARLWIELALWILGGVAFGTVYHYIVRLIPELPRWMPLLAMFGIIYVTGMTAAEGRNNLVHVGPLLVIATALHNVLGYLLGYWMSRAFGMERQSARTVSFEVGLQNGGMATGLAASMGKLGTLGLPAAIFIAWMNISGSLLANYWRRRPVTSHGSAPHSKQGAEH